MKQKSFVARNLFTKIMHMEEYHKWHVKFCTGKKKILETIVFWGRSLVILRGATPDLAVRIFNHQINRFIFLFIQMEILL